MTNRNEMSQKELRDALPDDLRTLDQELSSIQIEERPSFAPELEGELRRAWQNRSSWRSQEHRPWRRGFMAAALAGLMIAGVSVPSARAAVARLVRTVAQEARTLFSDSEMLETELPEIPARIPDAVTVESRTEVVVSPADASESIETSQPDLPTIPEVRITFPEIVSRPEAQRIIASYYPRELQQAGIDGRVKLLFWVATDGSAENIQIQSSSGNQELDFAAMLAVQDIQFQPATRNGQPVGTWVEVDVNFFAMTGGGIIGNDSVDGDS